MHIMLQDFFLQQFFFSSCHFPRPTSILSLHHVNDPVNVIIYDSFFFMHIKLGSCSRKVIILDMTFRNGLNMEVEVNQEK